MDDASRGDLVETPSGQNEGDVLQVNINPALNPEQIKQVEELIQEFPETFSEKPGLLWKGTSRQRSGKGAIRKKIPTPKTEVGKKKQLTIRYLYHENIL